MSDIVSRPYSKEGEDTWERVFGKKGRMDLSNWPAWCLALDVRQMTRMEFNALPEYSTSLPDSYKRPISDGGRPWKRNLNWSGAFGKEIPGMWLYCEYRPHSNPKLLSIYTAIIEITE